MKKLVEDHNKHAEAMNWELNHGQHDFHFHDSSPGNTTGIIVTKKGTAKNAAEARKKGKTYPIEKHTINGLTVTSPVGYHPNNPYKPKGFKTYTVYKKRTSSGKQITVKRKNKRRS